MGRTQETLLSIILVFPLTACQTVISKIPGSESANSNQSQILSGKCLNALAISKSKSTLATSPTFSASIDEEGDSNLSLRLDVMDFYRAGLDRKLTLANCRHDDVIQLARSISRFTSSRIARNSLLARSAKLNAGANAMQRQIVTMRNSGVFDKVASEKLLKSIRNLRKQAAKSEQRALSLEAINFDVLPDYESIENELSLSLTNLQLQKQDNEFYKNIRLNVAGGVRFSRDDENSISSQDEEQESFGSVSLSMKLGIFDPGLQIQQSRLQDIEFQQLHEPKTGILWQLKDLYQTNLRSEGFLLQDRSRVLEELTALKKAASNSQKPEKLLAAGISRLLLEADLAMINVNLKELRIILAKLAASHPHG